VVAPDVLTGGGEPYVAKKVLAAASSAVGAVAMQTLGKAAFARLRGRGGRSRPTSADYHLEGAGHFHRGDERPAGGVHGVNDDRGGRDGDQG
jgi:hypothetical protein